MDDLLEVLEEKQEQEKALLQEEITLMLKGAKKSKKRDLETKVGLLDLKGVLELKGSEVMFFCFVGNANGV
jgi:hypothetical protein